MPFILNNTAKASSSDITGFERRSGLTLPGDYRQFLATNNGGKCRTGGVFRETGTDLKISRVNIMLGLRDDPNYDLESALSRFRERMPEELLTIGYDSGGNYLLLDCSDSRRGTIYFFSLDSTEDEPRALASLPVVARSFSELLAQLESDKWGEAGTPTNIRTKPAPPQRALNHGR